MSNRSERIGTIIRLIANNPGIKLSGLRAKLSETGITVTERTITADIDIIKREYKLLSDRPRLREGYFLQGMKTIGEDEIGLVVDALSAFGVNLDDKKALEISRRLAAQSPVSIRRTGLRQRNIYQTATSQNEIENTLLTAIRSGYAVRLHVESPHSNKPLDLRVYPLFRVFHERGWYLITRNLGQKSYHPCRVDRIKSCEILKTEAANEFLDADVSQAQYLMNCGWGMDFPHTLKELEDSEQQSEIVVRFDRSIAKFIKEGINRHPKASIQPAPDGSGCVDFRIRLKYQNEFKHWIRSWGSKAWFLEPPCLIDEAKTEIRRQITTYQITLTSD